MGDDTLDLDFIEQIDDPVVKTLVRRVRALEAELERFQPTDDVMERFMAGDGEPAIRSRRDLYEKRDA